MLTILSVLDFQRSLPMDFYCFVLVILLVVVVRLEEDAVPLGGDLLTPSISFMAHQCSIRHERYLGYIFDYEETGSLFWQCHF